MDIVDVDEALKDDSFIFLEDKTHDDISNILQQWKSNNCIPPSSNNTSQKQQQQQQLQQEQAYKYDSRTFTRPKRKSAQNLELQFTNSSSASQNQPNNQQQNVNAHTEHPMLNLEIGGLVTNMHKSFLQDTSPPPFSSMDASMDRMNNSLITSADFSNINFLQSTNSLDFGGPDVVGFSDFNLTGKITSEGYTLSDMIRDRKALESLTMSSDGTLIKDSHIGQIDDISLTLSKTASGCSTMDNSTESVEANNRTVQMVNSDMDRTYSGGVQLELAACHAVQTADSNGGKQIPATVHQTMVLTDEMIGDITYNLVENSLYGSIAPEPPLNITHNIAESQHSTNENISKPASVLDETICLSTGTGSVSASVKAGNSTFECQNVTPDMRCETPEGVEKSVAAMKFYESTPQASSIRYNKHHYTPTLKMIDDVNISPIVANSVNTPLKAMRVLNETFENEQQRINKTNNVINTNTFSGKLPMMANTTTTEMIENIENPTFDKTFNRFEQQSPASIEMKNVMDLAQAEANLLASNNNEEEFDHMLDEFSRVELNAEQLKMKKSLDSIKRRFNYGPNREKSQQREISREAKDMRDMMRVSADLLGEEDHSSKDYLNMTMDIANHDNDEIKKSKEHLVESPHGTSESSELIKSPLRDSTVTTNSSITDSKISNGLSVSSVSNASTGGERLLSRRSRLYDDFNLSTLSTSSMHGTRTSLGSSFTVQRDDDNIGDNRPNITNETENLSGQTPLEMVQEKTESATTDNGQETVAATQYRLAEKRERDRDRFKTIKINKNRNGSIGDGFPSGSELNVPCIDDYDVEVNDENSENVQQPLNERFSRRDQANSPVFNNNKSEVELETANKRASKTNPNFLTYKKPKDKQQANVRNLPEVAPAPTSISAVASEAAASKPRSLSRPRYLSGLTKFSAVSKATSADELEKSIPRHTNLNVTTSALNSGITKGSSAANVSLNRTQDSGSNDKTSGELKSPMGIKSKSFHNLSSHHTYASASNYHVGGLPAPKTFGLKKPSATGISTEKLAKLNPNRNSSLLNPSSFQQPITQQKSDESVFKVPKLVSGIRGPGASMGGAAGKRAGLVRPSSGYYSLTVTAKGVQPPTSDVDCDNGRHSPTDSMSSASSRGSAQSLNKTMCIKTPNTNNTSVKTTIATATLTKITIGSTGIPKPSGLRPPSNIKRSGLPRPSSFIKTEK